MDVDFSIKIGDLLTISIAFLAFAAPLWYSIHKDSKQTQKEKADRIRNAAATMISKLDRWRDISLTLFPKTQPLFVRISSLFRGDNKEILRDELWKELDVIGAEIMDKIVSENLELINYYDLFGKGPEILDMLESTFKRLKELYEIMLFDYHVQTQDAILNLDFNPNIYNSAILGNQLRMAEENVKSEYKKHINDIIEPAKRSLLSIVLKSDEELLK
jgi:hypothetical protein